MREPGTIRQMCRTARQPRLVALASLAFVVAGAVGAQQSDAAAPAAVPLPFSIGEHLEYHVRLGKLGTTGQGSMSVSGPVDVRGTPVYLLRFDFRARVGPLKAVDETESWLDPRRMAALRFHKRERHPFSNSSQSVEMFPSEMRWVADGGDGGDSPTDAPLDELSFIYFIRTLPLLADSTYTFDRHFEVDRNPVTVRVVRLETIETKAGAYHTILVEMRVHDRRRYGDHAGIIRINFSDDRRRIPVRIESEMPIVGRAVFLLTADTP